ncbi:hypothetical protein C9890_0585 [Perkinsus sp. BL_2016]|nr:hypothetical protein C9890_0585 [Perkinsus sp. BL_2016]
MTQKITLLENITGNLNALVCDQFGNYVVQHALDFGRDIDRQRIVQHLALGNIPLLSCNKFASNVLEKAARLNTKSLEILIHNLANLNDSQLLDIMKDRYGNYVIKAFLELHKFPARNSNEVCGPMVFDSHSIVLIIASVHAHHTKSVVELLLRKRHEHDIAIELCPSCLK